MTCATAIATAGLRHCTIEAPMDGMVVMQTTYRGGEMNRSVGDRLARPTFMAVVDPNSMQLDAT